LGGADVSILKTTEIAVRKAPKCQDLSQELVDLNKSWFRLESAENPNLSRASHQDAREVFRRTRRKKPFLEKGREEATEGEKASAGKPPPPPPPSPSLVSRSPL
jgi:hypothetical protein